MADMMIFLCAPFAQAVSPVPAILSVAGMEYEFWAFGLTVVLAWVGSTVLGLFLMGAGRYAPKAMIPAVLLFPLFMATWLPLQVLSLLCPAREWKVIAHGGTKSEKELVP